MSIVTGGARGLGAAICRALLKQGHQVCVSDILGTEGRSFVNDLQMDFGSDNVIFVLCDVTKEDHYEQLFDATLKAFGKVEVLVNNAGIVTEKDPRKTIEVNLIGTILGCQTAFKYMGKTNGGKGGIVINTASIVGLLPFSSLPSYSASKHGVVGLTRSYGLPYYFEKEGITFAALCPFFIDTELLQMIKEDSAIADSDFTSYPDRMSPDYVAQGVLKLLEDKINGSTLVVLKDRQHYAGFPEELKDLSLE